jgi:hypothetical protein
MAWLNSTRRGIRTTQTVNPQNVKPDISEQIRTLYPEATPIITLMEKISSAGRPKSKKVQVRKYYATDFLDQITAVTVGTATETRFARLTVAQTSRPNISGLMYYPQDKLYIVATGQTVEVVMTPEAAYQINGSDLTLTAGLTGNTTTRSAAGTIVVRVVEPVAIVNPGNSDFWHLGRTIWESQPIQAQSYQRDVVFDYNFVEHKEAVLDVTEDELEYVQTYGSMKDFDFQKRETIEEFKKQINNTCWYSERAVNYDQNGRPTYHMRGLLNAIKTNVTVYNPTQSGLDFEELISNFMYKQAFRYQGAKRKFAFVGADFLHNFNRAFREYRRSDINVAKQTPGLNITTYDWMGYQLDLVRNETFRLGTPQSHWCCVIDPEQIDYHVTKNYDVREYSNNNERDKKLMIEWSGTLSFHLEEHHALLRTA